MGIETKSIGELIDALITADIGCWMAQDQVMKLGNGDVECAKAARRTQELNKRRSQLISSIDRQLGASPDPTREKTY